MGRDTAFSLTFLTCKATCRGCLTGCGPAAWVGRPHTPTQRDPHHFYGCRVWACSLRLRFPTSRGMGVHLGLQRPLLSSAPSRQVRVAEPPVTLLRD